MSQRRQLVRARYMRARRDYFYGLIKDEDARKKATLKDDAAGEVLDIPEEVVSNGTCLLKHVELVCPNCNREFKNKSALSSHLRFKTCEK